MSAPPNIFGSFGKPPENKENSGAPASGQPAPAPIFGAGFGATNSGTSNPFGAAPGSTAPPTGIFGGAPPAVTSATPAPFFGASAATGSGTSNTLFGLGKPSSAPTAAPGASTAPSLFAKPIFGQPASGAGPSLFGSSNASAAPTGATPNPLFGGAASAKPNPIFGGAAAPSATATAPQAATAAPLFGTAPAGAGGGPSLFGTKPSEPAGTGTSSPGFSLFGAAAPKAPEPPKSPFNLSTPATAAPAAATTGPSLFGGAPGGSSAPKLPSLFGNAPAAATGDPVKQATSAGETTPSFGADFFKKPTDPKPAEAAAPAASAPPPSGLFTGFGAPKETPAAPPAAKDEKEKQLATAAPPLFGLGLPKKPDEPTAAATSGSTAPPAPAPAASTSAAPSQPAAAAPKPAAPTPVPPSTLRGKSVEEIVNKWDQDLNTNVQEFNRIASEVAAWDKVLIENGNFIAQLYNQVLTAENQQQQIDHTLSSIEAQQDELSNALDLYEKQAKDALEGQNGALKSLDSNPADQERDRNYTLATNLSVHLDDLTKSITQMIEAVNDLSISSGAEASSKEDPLTQIAEVLNEHLASLNWIDGAIGEMESRVKDVAPRLGASRDPATDSTKLKASGYRWTRG